MSIKNNITSLQSLLDKVNALPEASSGSGPISYDTCTVTFDNESISDDTYIRGIAAMVVEDGVIKPYLIDSHTRGLVKHHTVSNVVCGSVIKFNFDALTRAPWIEIDGSAVFESYEPATDMDGESRLLLTLTAPSVANEICTIYYAYDA